jgi:hypothetical protein
MVAIITDIEDGNMKKLCLGLMFALIDSCANTAPASTPYQTCPPGTYPQQIMQYNGYVQTVCQQYQPQFQPYYQPGFSINIPFYGRHNEGRWEHEGREHHGYQRDRD